MNINFTEKYIPKTIEELPIEYGFIKIIKTLIDLNDMKLILIGYDDYLKNIVINAIIRSFNAKNNEILYISQIKDQGVSNMRYELKLFSQVPLPEIGKRKILVLDDIHVLSENIQKLIVNTIDKWSKNINIITTTKTIYSVDEGLASRLVPLNIPNVEQSILKNRINKICYDEKLQLGEKEIDYILKINENNIPAILNILHKCKLLQKSDKSIHIDEMILKKCCTLINCTDFKNFIECCKDKSVHQGYMLLMTFIDNGYSVMDILNEFYYYVKVTDNLEENEKYQLFKIISNYIISFITIHEEELELLIFTYDISKIFQAENIILN